MRGRNDVEYREMHMHSHHDGHSHSHAHDHGHGHNHAHPAMKPAVLAWAMAATLGLVVAEVFGGLLGRSVALLNDAVHNLSDVPALGISWLAMRWAQRPADSEKTYGYHRAGTLAAFTNAVLLIILALWLGYEAIERLQQSRAGGGKLDDLDIAGGARSQRRNHALVDAGTRTT